MAEITTKESPFTPGRPVPIEYFIARTEEINRLRRSIKQASTGRNENIFITGERGIGKSSLAALIRYIAVKEHKFIGTHCYLGGARDLENSIRVIFQRLLQEVSEKTIFDDLKNLFDRYIKSVTLFGIGVEFTKDSSELRSLVENFLPAIRRIYDIIKTEKEGILLILDDMNGVANLPEFAQFLKSFVDELATSGESIPLLIILVGIPERRGDLFNSQPSIARIFDIIDLQPMGEKESSGFFNSMFREQNISIDDEALSLILRFSGGFPMLMHEVGDAVFWSDNDGNVDNNDAMKGIVNAANNVGIKYLDPQVYRVLRSKNYRSILRRVGKLPLGHSFQRNDILDKIPEGENTLDNFLRRIKRLGIISGTGVRGEYRFVNQLYHLYISWEALEAEKED